MLKLKKEFWLGEDTTDDKLQDFLRENFRKCSQKISIERNIQSYNHKIIILMSDEDIKKFENQYE